MTIHQPEAQDGARTKSSSSGTLPANTDLPLKRIALQVGYRHTASFSVAFRRACGETPSSFRSRQRKNRPPRANL